MPKDWDAYKAELERLYMTEKKTLLEIQKLLEDRGFKASVRAYRMRFDEWGFQKYNLKKRARPQALPTILHVPAMEPNRVYITTTDSEEDEDNRPSLKRPRRPGRSIHPGESAQNHSISQSANDKPSDSQISLPGDIAMLSVGGFMVPRWPTSREHLFSCIPRASGLQLFALLRTWRKESFFMDCLNEMIYDRDAHKFFLDFPEKVDVGGDHFEIDNIFEYAKALVDPGVIPQVYRCLLLSLSLPKFLPYQSPIWVVAWRKAANACTWEHARYLLLCAELFYSTTNSIIESSKGEIFVLESVLEHHHGILNNDRECEKQECNASSSWHLKREFLQMFDRCQSLEHHVHAKFGKFCAQIALSVIGAAPEENKKSPDLLLETEDKENKYRRVISKYTDLGMEKGNEELERLLRANERD